jgi:hypothetical protein
MPESGAPACARPPARRTMRPLLLVTALLELSGASLVPNPALRPEAPPRRCRRSASLRMGAFALKPTVTLDADVGAAYKKTKIGVLLLNLGGPDDLDAVEPFLCANPPDSAVHDAPLHAHWAPQNALEAPPPRGVPPSAPSAQRSHPPVALARAQVQPLLRPGDHHAAVLPRLAQRPDREDHLEDARADEPRGLRRHRRWLAAALHHHQAG